MKKRRLTMRDRIALAYLAGNLSGRGQSVGITVRCLALVPTDPVEPLAGYLAAAAIKPPAAYETAGNMANVLHAIWEIERLLDLPHSGRTSEIDAGPKGKSNRHAGNEQIDAAYDLAEREFAAIGRPE
jgi:hypothetical protein